MQSTSTSLSVFCLVMQNLNLTVRKPLTSQNWRIFYKIIGLYTPQTSISWTTKAEKLQIKKIGTMITQCIMWSWTRQLIKCDKNYILGGRGSYKSPDFNNTNSLDCMFLCPQNSYVETLTPNWWYLEEGLWEIIRFRSDHEGGTSIIGALPYES